MLLDISPFLFAPQFKKFNTHKKKERQNLDDVARPAKVVAV